jgi:hypothetical protein
VLPVTVFDYEFALNFLCHIFPRSSCQFRQDMDKSFQPIAA